MELSELGPVPNLELLFLGRPEVRVDGRVFPLESRKSLAALAILAADGPTARHRLAGLLWESFPQARANANLRHALHGLQARLPRLLSCSDSRVDLSPEVWSDLHHAASDHALHRGVFCEGLELKDCPAFETWLASQRARWRDHAVSGWLAQSDRYRQGQDGQGALDAAHRALLLDPLSEPAHAAVIALLRARGDLAAARRQWDSCLAIHLRELGTPPSILSCWGPAVSETASCKIYLLGKPRVVVAGEIVPLPYQRATALLAYLARQGEAVEREPLRQLLWPGLEPAKAAANLRHAVHQLRKALGDALANHEDLIWLDRARVWLDLDWLESESQPITTVGEFCEGLEIEDSPAFIEWLAKQRAYFREKRRPPSLPDTPSSGNLPAQLSAMVGGQRALHESGELLSRNRLLTITGPAGVGKTRLALELARQSRGQWSSLWLVELGSLFDPERLLDRVSSTLGISEGPGDLRERLQVEIGSRSALLLLDNCEHLISAAAELTASLLERCPALKIVATSRELLRVPGESVMNLDPLRVPPESCLEIEEISAYPAVELFVERASAAAPQFRFNAENAVAIAGICRRLDGLPLAIELAAVRVRSLPVAQIARGLSDKFRLLRGGPRTVPQRQQTLEGALAWSHDMLGPEEKVVFRRLCVFAGGFDLAAAAAVCQPEAEPEELLEPLTGLIDRSMVLCRESGGVYRYSLLETVRDFAYRELERSPETEEIRARHFELFSRRAQDREEPGVAGLLALEPDHGNFCVALEWGLIARPEQALGLAAALGDYWFYRGRFSEGAAYLQRAMAVRDCPRALLWSGRLHQALGQYEPAEAEFEASAALARDPLDRARAWNARAQAGYSQGDYVGSSQFALSALALWQAENHLHGIVDTLNMLATAQICLGQDAQSNLSESELLSRQDDYTWGLSGSLYLQGLQGLYRGHYAEAQELLGQSLVLCRSLGNAPRVAACLGNLGLAATADGDHRLARAHFEEGTALAEASGYLGVVAFLSFGNGFAALKQGQTSAAAHLLRESLRVLLSIRVRESADLVLLCLAAALDDEAALPLRRAALAFKAAQGSVMPAYLGWLAGEAADGSLSLEQAMRLAVNAR